MRILYITSGYFGIYQFFDQSILNTLKEKGHFCRHINLYSALGKGFSKFQRKTRLFHPDLVLTMNGFVLTKEISDWLKEEGITCAVWMSEDPYYIDLGLDVMNRYDYLFTIDSASLETYKKHGHPNAHLLPLGTDDSTFAPQKMDDWKSDVCLVGFPYPDRVEIIQKLLEETTYSITVAGGTWKEILEQHSSNHRLNIIDWIPPEHVSRLYHEAKVVINTHRPHDLEVNQNSLQLKNRSINNRTFDIAANESFQLISHMPDLRTYFAEDEVPSFSSFEELKQLLGFYIPRSAERLVYAKKARKKAVSEHTFQHRMNTMLSIIGSSCSTKSSEMLSQPHWGRWKR